MNEADFLDDFDSLFGDFSGEESAEARMERQRRQAKEQKVAEIQLSGARAALLSAVEKFGDADAEVSAVYGGKARAWIRVGRNCVAVRFSVETNGWMRKLPIVLDALSDEDADENSVLDALRKARFSLSFIPKKSPKSDKFGFYMGSADEKPLSANRNGEIRLFATEIGNTRKCEKIREFDIRFAKKIGEYAFSGCRSLEKISIPKTVRKVAQGAFGDVQPLREVHFLGTLEEWLSIRFNHQEPSSAGVLSQYEIDMLLSVVGDSFDGNCPCDGGAALFIGGKIVKNLVITGEIRKIGGQAFRGCGSLESVELSEGVREIEEGAFSGCRSLVQAGIPDSARKFGELIFEGSGIKKIDSKNYKIVDEFVVNRGILERYAGDAESVEIPEIVRKIGPGAFKDAPNLRKVVIPPRVKVSVKSFRGAEKIREIVHPKLSLRDGFLIQEGVLLYVSPGESKKYVVPGSAKRVESGALSDIKRGAEVEFSEGVEEIMPFAQIGSRAVFVTLPRSLKKIGGRGIRVHDFGAEILPKLFFAGTRAEWDAIEKESDSLVSDNAASVRITCSDGKRTVRPHTLDFDSLLSE